MNEKINGQTAFNTLGEFLQQDGWHPEELDDAFTYHMIFNGTNETFSVYARIRAELELLLCYSSCPFNIPEELRPVAAEFITRANYGLRVGNFELDFEDGEVRFKNSIDFEKVSLVPQLIKNTLYPCAYTLDRYMPALKTLVYVGQSASDALAVVEN
jgi:hypothetical protein